MAGLDTRGLADGFAQGFGLMNQYQRGQRADARADQQMEIQQERLGMQREQFGMQQEEAQRARDMEDLQFTLGKIGQGMEVDESEIELLQRYPKYWAALDPDTDASIEQAMAVIDPNTSVDANDPESLAALNQMFGAEINRGEGGQKRVVGMVPAPDGESVMLELEVVGEDGSRYTAPMTEGRGTGEDDLVMAVPVERLVEQTQGMRMLRNVFRTPEAQQRASQVLGLLRGDSAESWDLEEHPRLGMIQVNRRTGEIKPVRPGAGSPYDRSGSSGGRPPSRIQEAEELVSRGVYDSFAEAYEAVRARAGESSQMDSRYIDFLGDELDRVNGQLDSHQLTEEQREQLQAQRDQLQAELDAASRQAFNRPSQDPEPGPQGQGGLEPGHVEDGYEYLGGDPGDPSNWRQR
ncbi:hypothetical protein HPA02_08480 [Bisbaumannia pacifica]|uniref:Uncharacterized protein n=1 Tax=Bisbaumannia pacifica TaxID=77098 RepID=A0A510X7X6_9GAMM|nr:hypothetical protein [Halomonas pacifica]GEK46565.1 hypothetical protein HPA02_08480 [Halomonas pacifica]